MKNNTKTLKIEDLFLPHFMEVWEHIYKINPILREKIHPNMHLDNVKKELITKFIFKGSRKTGKTRTIIKIMLLIMIIDPHSCWVVLMQTKQEQGFKIIREFQKEIERLDKYWPGFHNQWEHYLANGNQKLVRNNGEWKQEIRFLSVEDDKGGLTTDNPHVYFAGWFLDEAINRKQQYKMDFTDTEEILDSLVHLDDTIERTQNDIRNYHNHQVWGLLRFIALNPNQGLSPILQEFNKYLPDNLEKQCLYEYQSAINVNKQEYYSISSLGINTWLDELSIKSIYEERWNWSTFLTDRYSQNNYGKGTLLSHIWHKVDKKQEKFDAMNEQQLNEWKSQCIVIGVGIDVGDVQSKTSVQIVAWHPYEHILTSIGEYVYDPNKAIRKLNINEVAQEVFQYLWDFEINHSWLKLNRIPLKIRIDGSDIWYQDKLNNIRGNIIDAMAEAGHTITPGWKPPLEQFIFDLAREKWSDDWDTYERSIAWESGLGTGIILPIRKFTSELYRELPIMKIHEGKRLKQLGKDDCINAFEYGGYHLMHRLFDTNHALNKDEIEEIINNK